MQNLKKNFLIIPIVFGVLFAINPNWFYLEIGGPDQWAALMYLEKFNDIYPDIIGARTSRFGWLIPGQFFINNFGEIGIVLFPVVYFLILIFTYFFLLNLFFNINLSLFLSLFALTYMELHGSYGWLYMSNFAATYLIVSIYFFFKGLKKNKKFYYFISGFFSAIAILTYSTSILFFILFPLVLFLNYRGNFKQFLKNSIIFLLGIFSSIILASIYFYLLYDIFLTLSHFYKFRIPFIFTSFDYTIYFTLKWKEMLSQGWSAPKFMELLRLSPSYALCLFTGLISTFILIKENFFLKYLRDQSTRNIFLFCFYALANHSVQIIYALLTYLFFKSTFLYPKHHFFLVLGLSTILSLSAIFYLLKKEIFYKNFEYKKILLYLLFPLSLIFFYYNNDLIDNYLFFGSKYKYIILICILFSFILFKKKFQSVTYLIIFLIFMNIQSSSGQPPVTKAISYYNYDRCSNRKDLFLTTFGITKYLQTRIDKNTNYKDFRTRYSFVFDQEDNLEISRNDYCKKIYKFYEKNSHPVYNLWYYKKPLMSIGESVQYYFENKYLKPQQFMILNYWHSTWAEHKTLFTLLNQSVNNENHELVLISSENKTDNLLNLIKDERKFQFKLISKKNFKHNNISVNVLIFSFKKN